MLHRASHPAEANGGARVESFSADGAFDRLGVFLAQPSDDFLVLLARPLVLFSAFAVVQLFSESILVLDHDALPRIAKARLNLAISFFAAWLNRASALLSRSSL